MFSEFTLGTVQLGTKYGINNKLGKPTQSDSSDILEYAYNHGIKSIDTASAYGNSEKVIGKWIKQYNPKEMFITTKVQSIRRSVESGDRIYEHIKTQVLESAYNLNVETIDNLLIHDFGDLLYYNDKLFNALCKLKYDGIVSNIGCSIYNLNSIDCLMKYNFDTIQIPASILNQSIMESEQLTLLKSRGIKVFARSIFVQGLIFMDLDSIPEKIKEIRPYVQKLSKFATRYQCTKAELAVNYVINHKNIDSVLLGVESITQLRELVNIDKTIPIDYDEVKEEFSRIPDKLVDPRKWS